MLLFIIGFSVLLEMLGNLQKNTFMYYYILKVGKNLLNLQKKFPNIMEHNWIFIKYILKLPNCNVTVINLSQNYVTVKEFRLYMAEFRVVCNCIKLRLQKRKIIPITSFSIFWRTYTRGVSWNLPVLLIDVARDMYTFLWFGIYVIFFYGQ